MCCVAKPCTRMPTQRYQTVGDLIRDVDHYLNSEPLEARPVSFGYWLGKFVRRNERAVVASSLAFILVAGLIVFFTVRLAKAQAAAARETAITTAMNRFLTEDLLGQTDPFRSKDAKESFADVVLQSSPQIDSKFRTEPLVAARLHQVVARAFDNRSDFPRARREYSRATELFKQAQGPLSEDAIKALLQRTSMEARVNERGSLETAKSLLGEAEKTISKIATPGEDLAVWLLSARGYIAVVENDGRAANEYFADAFRRAKAIPSFDNAALMRIKRTLAFSWIRLADGAKAEPLFRELAEAYARTGGPDSPYTLQARVNLSQALMIQRKYHDAIENANLIYPALVRRLGEDHEVTMAMLGNRAASEGSLGMWDEAIRDDLTAYNLSVRKQGPESFYSIAMLSDAGLSQCRAGRYAEGEPNARQAYEKSRQTFGPRAGLTGGTAYALATCLIRMNKQLSEASELLQNVDLKAVTAMSGDSSTSASVALAQGEIAVRQGNYVLAQRYAQTAAPTFEGPDSNALDKQEFAALKNTVELHLRK